MVWGFYQIFRFDGVCWCGHEEATSPLNDPSNAAAASEYLTYLRSNPVWSKHTYFNPAQRD